MFVRVVCVSVCVSVVMFVRVVCVSECECGYVCACGVCE